MRRYIAREVLHAILIDRKGTVAPNVATEQMGEVLERGESIILFPEGTRGDGSELAPFKSGLFYLASRCPTAEMVPVYLENLSRILPKGEVLPVPLLGSVSFGTPMLLEPGEEKAAFLTRARANLLALGESK
jgi:1-acyl-sn-glycerol-3-phosphate acyltransferase